MRRISILNATAEDFAIEVVSSLPAGPHEDGRIVKYLTHVYTWDGSQWVKFANLSDFSSLETRLSTQESTVVVDVASLETIDGSLETRISTEEDARSTAVSSINTLATTAEGSLETRLSGEEVNREADVDS